MGEIASRKLNRIIYKAKKKQAEANDLKDNAVKQFYNEISSTELENMLNIIEEQGQTWQRQEAKQLHEKVRNSIKFSFDEANKCIELFEANYSNFLAQDDQ